MRAVRFTVAALLAMTVCRSASGGEGPRRVDRYGDPLPEGAVARLGTMRWRNGFAQRLAYTPDGKGIVTCGCVSDLSSRTVYSALDVVRQWDRATGRQVERWRMPRSAKELRIADIHAGRKLVALYNGRDTLDVWDAGRGKTLLSLPGGGRYDYVAISPRGTFLAAWEDEPAGVHVWDVATGKQRHRLAAGAGEGRVSNVSGRRSLVFSDDERALAAVVAGRSVRLWDLSTGKQQTHQKITKSPFWITALAVSPDGKTLAWGLPSHLYLWDVARDRGLHHLTIRGEYFNDLAFSPDGKTLASGRTLRLWDVATGKLLPTQPAATPSWAECLSFSPDGKELAAMEDSTVRRWAVASGKDSPVAGVHRGPVTQVAFGPDSRVLASRGGAGTLAAWGVRTGKDLWHDSGHSEDGQAGLAVSPDGKTLATLSGDHTAITLRDLTTGRRSDPFGPGGKVSLFAFTPGGQTLRLVTEDNKGQQWQDWQVATGKETRRLPLPRFGQNEEVSRFYEWKGLLSPDGRLVAPGAWDRRIWGAALSSAPEIAVREVATGKDRPAFRVPCGQDVSVARIRGAFSDDGRTLALAVRFEKRKDRRQSWSDSVFLIETATGRERGRLDDPGVNANNTTLATDGRLVAFSDEPYFGKSPIRVWDAATGKEVGQFRQTDNVLCLAFSADRKLLASGLADSTVLVWDLAGINEKLHPGAKELPARELDGLWADLKGADAGKAFRAIHRLAGASKEAVPLLARRVRPARAVDERETRRLIDELNSNTFAVRRKAEGELAALGDQAEPVLRRVLAGRPTLDARRRVERLLAPLGRWRLAGENLGKWRALEALERIGTPEARRVLQTLADGAPDAWLTREAKASLLRLR